MKKNDENSLVLAVETSGRIGSVAIGKADNILKEVTFSGAMRHSAELFGSVRQLLGKIGKTAKDVKEIYIASGPGSFTGLRIAVTMAKMSAFANGTKIVACNTMDVIAVNAAEYANKTSDKINRIATILDAKRKQFYIAIFDRNGEKWDKVMNDCLMTVAEFTDRFGGEKEPVWLLGEGLQYYKDDFEGDSVRIMDEICWPAKAAGVYKIGRKMALAGEFIEAGQLVPFYLRRPEAVENWEKMKKGHRVRGSEG